MTMDAVDHGGLPRVDQPRPRPDWLARVDEPVIDPGRRIVDCHHHFSDHWGRYFAAECLQDMGSGHDVRASVFVQCGLGYRQDGPAHLAPVGETERALAIATSVVPSMPASAAPVRLCAGIVGYADLQLGDGVREVLEAHRQAGEGRFRGIRASAARDPSFRHGVLARPPLGLYADRRFRRGFAHLAPLGLSFDALCYHPQLDALIDLVLAFPDTVVIVNHVGCPLGVGEYRGRRREVLAAWRRSMSRLAECPNVHVKLGGMGMATSGLDFHLRADPPSSAALAEALRPYVDVCIERFGARRCMFESNFPVDKGMAGYRVLWNAFKRLAAGASEDEKDALFHDTAVRCYRLAQETAA